jgi:hypothetical protein
MPQVNLVPVETDRGFLRADFQDLNGDACSIQESSRILGGAIWLGMNAGSHSPRNEYCLARMHLDREMALALIPVLQRFAETGRIG